MRDLTLKTYGKIIFTLLKYYQHAAKPGTKKYKI
jgi:hypothetical protein